MRAKTESKKSVKTLDRKMLKISVKWGKKSRMWVKLWNSATSAAAAGEIHWLVKGWDAKKWTLCNLQDQVQGTEQTPAEIFCI